MWNDEWESLDDNQTADERTKNPAQLLDNLTDKQDSTSSGWGSWGGWGLSSIISTATAGVSTLTSQVTQGISTVLENSIDFPHPEELAKQDVKEEKQRETTPEEPSEKPEESPTLGLGFDLGNLVSGVSHITKFVEKTGTKVIAGGLDTLETIGKKTMEVLQENDPGLKKKRAFLKLDQDKPILSQILREAKEKAEQENQSLEKKHVPKKLNYETLFDDHQGLVHLEALEMLSKQCDIKLQALTESLTGESLKDLQETMDQVKELCEIPEEEDEESSDISEIKEKLESAVTELNIPITYSKVLLMWDETEEWLNKLEVENVNEKAIHEKAIESLAQLTALAVEQYHKAGELLLIKDHRSTADEADSLVQ